MPAMYLNDYPLLLRAGSIALMLSGCNELDGRLLAYDGARAYKAGRYDEAVTKYDEAHARLPDNVTVLRNLALANLAASRAAAAAEVMTKHIDRAVALLRQALELMPPDEARELTELLVNTWIESGRLGEAAGYFHERANSGNAEAWHTLGQIEAQRGNFAAAILAYRERLRLAPEEAAVHVGIAILTWEWLRAGGPDDPFEGIEIAGHGLDAALEANRLDPEHPSALVYAGLLLRERAKLVTDPAAKEADTHRAEEMLEQVRRKKMAASQ